MLAAVDRQAGDVGWRRADLRCNRTVQQRLHGKTLNPAAGSAYDASHYFYGSGTSYSTPLVAAGAAILKQQRPTLTASDIKSVLVNTASPISATLDGALAGVMQTGAGRLNLAAMERYRPRNVQSRKRDSLVDRDAGSSADDASAFS
ncbi:MAG: S8 family serine peptidase [Bryobacteraceae bacterium]